MHAVKTVWFTCEWLARTAIAAMLGMTTSPAFADDHLVVQRNKSFATARLVVHAGDRIRFLNLDDVPHNAFSLSSSNPFDTGMSAKREAREIKLDKPGIVEVECAVHPGMKMIIEVQR
jgi:plastocyanin